MPDKQTVSRVVVSSQRNEHGEWVVKAYDQNNKRIPGADYFTNDKNDAEKTAESVNNAIAILKKYNPNI